MTIRAARLALVVCAASLSLLALSLLLVVLGWSTPLPGDWLWQEQAVLIAAMVGAPLLGGVVASKRPGNLYGWAWLGFGAGLALSSFGQNYVLFTAWVRPGSLPVPETVLAIGGAGWVSAMVILPYLLLLFPDGRPPSRRWRAAGWVAAFAGGMLLLLGAFRPRQRLGPIESPLGVEGALGEAIVVVTNVGLNVVFAAVILSAVSLVFRYRRAAGIERQQIKWFAYAAVLFGSVFAFSLIVEEFFGVAASVPYMAWVVFNNVPIVALYVAVGVAVLKYRLYDIDILINRTLVYGSLTVMLALAYFGIVTATQALFRTLTGQEESPQLVAVASTLAIAALFNPLRRRIQSFIDRRFYRRKYNARKTLESFSAKLRDDTDLNALEEDLVGVVSETMQPTNVSLWLRPDTATKTRRPN